MGYNTTVIVYNDALGEIEKDPQFGKNLVRAIGELSRASQSDRPTVDVPSGCHGNAAMVVETHHADSCALVTVAGNLGICHVTEHGWDHHEVAGQERMLRAWAKKLGFKLVKEKTPPVPAKD